MAPTRSAASRRKRNSTTEALDLLNSVMHRRASTAEDHQTQSSRPARQLRNTPRSPRRDIWEIPSSPERPRNSITRSSPLVATKLPTPRRSMRLHSKMDVQNSPLRTSHRTKRAGIENHKDNMHEGESKQPAHERNEHESADEIEVPNMVENEGNAQGDGERFPPSPHLRSPSPSEFLNQDLEQSGRFESTQHTPAKKVTPKRDTKVGTVDERVAQSALKSTPQVAFPGPSVIVHNSPIKVPETPFLRQSTRIRRAFSPAKDDDGDVEMDEGDDADSDFVESSDSASSSSSTNVFIHQGSPGRPSLSTTRSGKVRQPPDTDVRQPGKPVTLYPFNHEPVTRESSEASGYGRNRPPSQDTSNRSRKSPNHKLNLPRKSSSRLPFSGSNRQGLTEALVSRRIRNRSSRVVINYSNHESPEPKSSYPRCKEAMKFGRQQQNWEVLIHEARKMKKTVSLGVEEHFEDIMDIIDSLREWYEGLYQQSEDPPRLSSKDAQKYETSLNHILREGDQILDTVYYLVVNGRKKEGCKLFEGFEACVIPAVIELIFAAFDGYHSNPKRFPDIYDHLHSTLRILSWLCSRMTSLAKERYVQYTTRSRNLHQPLHTLIEASKSGLLEHIESEESDQGRAIIESTDEEEGIPLVATQRPWTDAEGYALLDGLLRHHGPGRYALIMRDFGDKLRGRTMRELRDKARETHDQFTPQIQDQLHTREGREEWHWLLSVRE